MQETKTSSSKITYLGSALPSIFSLVVFAIAGAIGASSNVSTVRVAMSLMQFPAAPAIGVLTALIIADRLKFRGVWMLVWLIVQFALVVLVLRFCMIPIVDVRKELGVS